MDTLVSYAKSFLGKPYIWGGDDPIKGFDCSGYIQEVLSCVGFDAPGDQTAHGLYQEFRLKGKKGKGPGALAFYGSKDRITHVAFMIDDWRVIEAAGGGRDTNTVEEAARDNAYIRMRPLTHRKDLVATYFPRYKYLSYGNMQSPFSSFIERCNALMDMEKKENPKPKAKKEPVKP